MLLNLFNYKITGKIMNNDLLIGKPLPNFELQTSNNNLLKDTDLIGKLKLIFIYPKNDTSGCTKENILFSENINQTFNVGTGRKTSFRKLIQSLSV